MAPFLAGTSGTPRVGHAVARAAKTALEEAREEIADAARRAPGGGGVHRRRHRGRQPRGEGRGARRREAGRGDGVVTTAFEHKGVLASCAPARGRGLPRRRGGHRADGVVDLDALADALDERTVVVSVMLVNNEVGTIQPLDEIAALVRERAPRAVLHTDAVQAVPWLDVAARAARVPTSSRSPPTSSVVPRASARSSCATASRSSRSSRVAVRNAGCARARRTSPVPWRWRLRCASRATQRDDDVARSRGAARPARRRAAARRARERRERRPGAQGRRERAPLRFDGVEAEALLVALDVEGVCAAAGSSCASGATEPSHVLAAMGLSRAGGAASVRLSLGFRVHRCRRRRRARGDPHGGGAAARPRRVRGVSIGSDVHDSACWSR